MIEQDIIQLLEAREGAQNALTGVLTEEQRERLNKTIKSIDFVLATIDSPETQSALAKILHVQI